MIVGVEDAYQSLMGLFTLSVEMMKMKKKAPDRETFSLFIVLWECESLLLFFVRESSGLESHRE